MTQCCMLYFDWATRKRRRSEKWIRKHVWKFMYAVCSVWCIIMHYISIYIKICIIFWFDAIFLIHVFCKRFFIRLHYFRFLVIHVFKSTYNVFVFKSNMADVLFTFYHIKSNKLSFSKWYLKKRLNKCSVSTNKNTSEQKKNEQKETNSCIYWICVWPPKALLYEFSVCLVNAGSIRADNEYLMIWNDDISSYLVFSLQYIVVI